MKPLKSMIFVPTYLTKFLDKAIDFKADALILDLEDSVPNEYKAQAREHMKDYLSKNSYQQQVFVRVNSISSGMIEEDINFAIHQNTTGFMLTKVQSEEDIKHVDELLTQLETKNNLPIGKFKLCPLIETASAVLRAYQIATSSKRIIALVLGGEDLLSDIDGLHNENNISLLVPRSLVVIAAAAAKIQSIDTPYLDVKNTEGFSKETVLARELGFSGKLLIHPIQIDVANKVFSPSEAEIEEAKRIIEAIKESEKNGQGVTLLDGKMVGPPMQKRAKRILEQI